MTNVYCTVGTRVASQAEPNRVHHRRHVSFHCGRHESERMREREMERDGDKSEANEDLGLVAKSRRKRETQSISASERARPAIPPPQMEERKAQIKD